MIGKNVEESDRGLFYGTIQALAWKKRGKPWQMSVQFRRSVNC